MASNIDTTGVQGGTSTSSWFMHTATDTFTNAVRTSFLSPRQMEDRERRALARQAKEEIKADAPPHPDVDPNNPDDEGFVPVSNYDHNRNYPTMNARLRNEIRRQRGPI